MDPGKLRARLDEGFHVLVRDLAKAHGVDFGVRCEAIVELSKAMAAGYQERLEKAVASVVEAAREAV